MTSPLVLLLGAANRGVARSTATSRLPRIRASWNYVPGATQHRVWRAREAITLYDRCVDRTEYKRTALENWQTIAAGWERRRAQIERTTRPVTDWMVRALDPQPGDTVLELAAGPGDVGFGVAPLLGEEGRLISSDFSSEMLEV